MIIQRIDRGVNLPMRRTNKPVSDLPMVSRSITYRNVVHRSLEDVPNESNTMDIGAAPAESIQPNNNIETVDIEKIADMVYSMLRQDLMVEIDWVSRVRR